MAKVKESRQSMIEICEASEEHVEGIRDLFLAAYGRNYAYPSYYDLRVLKKMVYDDDMLLLVAVDENSGRVAGTASVIFDLGEFGDLVGEFGRLVVHPDFGNQGIGKKLMNARLENAKKRLHFGFVENRTTHPFSQKISDIFGFAAAGFLPQKHRFKDRESLAIYLRLFADALKLRRNNPRVIPEAYLLAQKVMASCDMEPDAIPDEDSPGYPHATSRFEIEEMTTTGYASLLRFERARMHQKEIFGPARIHQGLFQLEASQSNYKIAREDGQLVGAIGYTVDANEKTATIFEIVTLDNRPIRFLLESVISKCRDDYQIEYIETDVSAYSPRMQRTLLELQFLPVGYLPAFTFVGPERLDAVRMARVFIPVDMSAVHLFESTKPIAEIVLRNFSTRDLLPRLGEALPGIPLFSGLSEKQLRRVAEICELNNYVKGEIVIEPGQESEKALVVLEGELIVKAGSDDSAQRIGTIPRGACFGETALLGDKPHSVYAETAADTEVAVIEQNKLLELMRKRPDIGVILYKNLAESLGQKLRDVAEKFR